MSKVFKIAINTKGEKVYWKIRKKKIIAPFYIARIEFDRTFGTG